VKKNPRIAIIGAGPSGIAAAKNMLAVGLDNLVLFDRQDQVGGNWVFQEDEGHSSVYETTHIISSKRWSQYEDFPMPDDYPDYPSHRQLLAYFQAYADHFGVTPYVQFETTVEHATLQPDSTWHLQIRQADGSLKDEHADYLLVASGHHWAPNLPEYPGHFAGRFMHAHAYKRAEPFRGKRVLVIGGGNSACDIAVETARVSEKTALSIRRGYYFMPKFLFGFPSDTVYNRALLPLPRKLRQQLIKLTLLLVQGPNSFYGLPRPDHQPLEVHPTLNSELLYFIRHGRIHPRPGIERLEDYRVHFTDGTSEEFDVIIAATGYRTQFPFFSPDFFDISQATEVPLYYYIFHPEYATLFFIGLVQPLGCIWPLADWQSRLVAQAILGNWKPPADMRERIARQNARHRRLFRPAHRHAYEVDFLPYRKQLIRELKRIRSVSSGS